eukprot:345639-Chlamydomonas_euryale.AAC.1
MGRPYCMLRARPHAWAEAPWLRPPHLNPSIPSRSAPLLSTLRTNERGCPFASGDPVGSTAEETVLLPRRSPSPSAETSSVMHSPPPHNYRPHTADRFQWWRDTAGGLRPGPGARHCRAGPRPLHGREPLAQPDAASQ